MTRQTGTVIRETADGERDPLAAEKDLAEAEWEAALTLFFQEQSARIRARLEPGIPKSRKALEDLGDRLTDKFWDNEDRELLAVMTPRLTAGALTGVTGIAATMDAMTIGVDWTLVNTEAAKWAREYTGQLIGVNTGGINAATRRRVGERVAEFIETPGMTMDDLFDRLNTSDFSFGPVRARMISVTEVTRSYWQGTKAAGRWVEDEGYFKWRKTWQTLRDELVCFACGPLHGTTVDGIDTEFQSELGPADGPPLHPRCRCFITQSPIMEEVAEEGAELIDPRQAFAQRKLDKINWNMGEWEQTKPWLASREDVIAGRVTGVAYNPKARYVARNDVRSGNIVLGPSYFDSPYATAEGDRILFYHEAGHTVGDVVMREKDWIEKLEPFRLDTGPRTVNSWYDNPFGISQRPDEVLADGFADIAVHDWAYESNEYIAVVNMIKRAADLLGFLVGRP